MRCGLCAVKSVPCSILQIFMWTIYIHKCSISFSIVGLLFSICRYYCRQLCRWNYSRTERDCYALPEDVVLSGPNQLHTIRLHHTPVFTWGQRNSAHTCRYAVWSAKLTILLIAFDDNVDNTPTHSAGRGWSQRCIAKGIIRDGSLLCYKKRLWYNFNKQ